MSGGCFQILANPFILASVLWVLLVSTSTSRADIYSYTDKDGVVHFSNVPTETGWKLIIKEKRFDPKSIKYQPLISKISKKYKVDNSLIKAIIRAESNFNPKAVSKVGARGLMQLMPETAEELNVNDSFNPKENIEGGVKYFKYLLDRFKGELPLAIAAYHAGESTVRKYNGIPPYSSTKKYVKNVLKFFKEYQR